MTEMGMEISIKANVANATQGLNKVQQDLAKTAVAASKFDSAMVQASAGSNQATQALGNLSRVVQDAPFGFLGIANNINPLLESFQRLKATSGSTGGALKAMAATLTGPAGLGIAVSVISSLLVVFGDKLFNTSKAADKAKESFDGMLNTAAEEALKLKENFAAITNANIPLENRKKIIEGLRSEYGVYLKNISDEALLTGQAAGAYDLINNAILRKLQLQAAEEKILPLIKEQVQLQYELNKLIEAGANLRRFIDATAGRENFKIQADNAIAIRDSNKNLADQLSLQRRIAAVGKEINNLFGNLSPLLQFSAPAIKGVTVKIDKPKAVQEVEARLKELSTELAPIPIRIRPMMGGNLDGSITREEANFLSGSSSVLDALNSTIALNNADKERQKIEKMREELLKLGDTLNGFVTPAFNAAFEAMANGDNPIKAVGEALNQLVIELVKAALKAALLSLIINTIAPGSAGFSFGGLFSRFLGGGGIPGMAQGGIVPPGFPNDTYPAMLSSNEAVIPLDRMGEFLRPAGGSDYLPMQALRGDTLYLWYQRATNSFNRRK